MARFSSAVRGRIVEPVTVRRLTMIGRKIDLFGHGAAEEGDDRQAAILGERGDVLFEIGGADHVEHDIDAMTAGLGLDDVGKILALVVDCPLRAELFAGFAFLLRTCGRIDLGAEGAGELDRRRADAAGAAVDENAFAFRQPRHLEKVCPDGEEGFRKGCGLHRIVAFRERQDLAYRQQAIFGIGAAIGEAADLVADRVSGNTRADGCHFTGKLEAKNGARILRRRVNPLALRDIRAVDADCLRADEDLALARRRNGSGRYLHDVRRAEARQIDKTHVRWQGHDRSPLFAMRRR